ncbi:alpha/beta hydrolase [Mycobacterium tuberculosis]
MRDLLSVLDIERVTIVGHSLGGGVAMQFAYQFPQLVDRLILVSAGGVTRASTSSSGWPRCPWAARLWLLLRLPLVLPARCKSPARIVGKAIGTTNGARPAQCAAHFGRPARADGFCGVRPHPAGQWWTGGGRWSPCWTDAI